MNVALLTGEDVFDRRAWSGVLFQMRESLSELADVHVVQVGVPRTVPDRVLTRVCKWAGRKYLMEGSIAASLAAGRAASRAVCDAGCDVVVAVAATCQVAALVTDLPVLHVNDATFGLIKDYYPYTTGLCRASSLQAEWVERRALRRVDACVFPSTWASRSAVVDYGVDARKVHVVEFGACMVPEGPPPATRTESPVGEHRLLFIAGSNPYGTANSRFAEWVRKGGPRAVRILDELIAAGHDASLSIVGDVPVDFGSRSEVRLRGYLDPNTKEGRVALSAEYLRADVLLDPTPATCTGLVLMDAAAHGLPVVAARTGGVPSVVADGETGVLLPLEAPPSDYATAVLRITTAQERERFSRLARQRHETMINWRRWAQKTLEIATGLTAGVR